MLLPVSTSTKLFHDYIKPNAKEIRFLKGRIKFEGLNTKGEFVNDKSPMHDSMIVIFDGTQPNGNNKMRENKFDKYLWTNCEELLQNATRLGEGKGITDGIIKIHHDKPQRNWSMDEINAIMNTIAEMTGENHLCTYMQGDYLGLHVVLNGEEIKDFKKEEWQVLESPKISCRKISHLKAHEIAPILISLNEHRELWVKSKLKDASKYFN